MEALCKKLALDITQNAKLFFSYKEENLKVKCFYLDYRKVWVKGPVFYLSFGIEDHGLSHYKIQ